MQNEYEHRIDQVMAILNRAVETKDVVLADRALRAYHAVYRAMGRLDRMAGAYDALPSWDVLK